MNILKTFLIIFVVTGFTQLKSDVGNNEFKTKILKNIRCLICQGQSVYDSESDFASSIKRIVEKKINEDSTDEEIYEFLREKYGDWIIYEPKMNKNTYILWLLPLLLFLLGGAIIKNKLKFKK
jgi:cytochrome c-type biogenesis protein CcmH